MANLGWTKHISDAEKTAIGPCLTLLAHYGYPDTDPLGAECHERGSKCPIRDKCEMLADIVLVFWGYIEPDDGERESPVTEGRVWHKGAWI